VPSSYSVASMVAPFIGLPLSECKTSGCCDSDSTCAITALRISWLACSADSSLPNLPANDVSVENVEDQVQVVVDPFNRTG